jgi:hypothetical protein
MGSVSALDFRVRVHDGVWYVSNPPEEPIGVVAFDFAPPNSRYIDGDLKDVLEEGLRAVAAWAWNSGLREGSEK